MIAYSNALLGTGTTMVLSPDSEFFRYFRSPNGGAAPTGPATPPARPAGRNGDRGDTGAAAPIRRASGRKVESGFRMIPMLNQSAGSSFVRPNGRTAI